MRWKEAEELQVKELEIYLRVLRKEYLNTLTSTANLVLLFWDQGQRKEAEELDV